MRALCQHAGQSRLIITLLLVSQNLVSRGTQVYSPVALELNGLTVVLFMRLLTTALIGLVAEHSDISVFAYILILSSLLTLAII